MNKDLEILKSTGMTESNAKNDLNRGTKVYELEEYLENFDYYTQVLEEESKKELKEILEAREVGSSWLDSEIVEYDGVKYYIEYCL